MISLRGRSVTLERMGISQWYANRVLVGASVSPDLSFDIQELSSDSAEGVVPNVEVPDVPDVNATQLLNDLKLPVSKEAASEAKAESQVKPELLAPRSRENVSRQSSSIGRAFCLRLYRWEHGVVVTESALDFPSPGEVGLLHNILKACGIKQNKPELLGCFNWPVFNLDSLPVSDTTKVEFLLRRWISEKASTASSAYLLMGHVPSLFQDAFEKEGGASKVVLDVSLMEMISMPAKKAQVWRQLRPKVSLFQGYVN